MKSINRRKANIGLLAITADFYLSISGPVQAVKPLNGVVGKTWKQQCTKSGQYLRSCCQEKAKKCRKDAGNNPNSKANCSERFKVCTKKIVRPQNMQTPAPNHSELFAPTKSAGNKPLVLRGLNLFMPLNQEN